MNRFIYILLSIDQINTDRYILFILQHYIRYRKHDISV